MATLMKTRFFSVLFLLAISLSSCVSKKVLQETATRYEGELAALRDQVKQLRIELEALHSSSAQEDLGHIRLNRSQPRAQ